MEEVSKDILALKELTPEYYIERRRWQEWREGNQLLNYAFVLCVVITFSEKPAISGYSCIANILVTLMENLKDPMFNLPFFASILAICGLRFVSPHSLLAYKRLFKWLRWVMVAIAGGLFIPFYYSMSSWSMQLQALSLPHHLILATVYGLYFIFWLAFVSGVTSYKLPQPEWQQFHNESQGTFEISSSESVAEKEEIEDTNEGVTEIGDIDKTQGINVFEIIVSLSFLWLTYPWYIRALENPSLVNILLGGYWAIIGLFCAWDWINYYLLNKRHQPEEGPRRFSICWAWEGINCLLNKRHRPKKSQREIQRTDRMNSRNNQ